MRQELKKKILNMKINLQKVTFHNGVVVAAKPVVVVAAKPAHPHGRAAAKCIIRLFTVCQEPKFLNILHWEKEDIMLNKLMLTAAIYYYLHTDLDRLFELTFKRRRPK
jgi:glucan phosphorylase